jgi:hypothetical protein
MSAGAGAAQSCGDAVLTDWFEDGRVDRLYDLQCYEGAIAGIPSDIRDYSDAEEVIHRALQAATRGRLAPGGPDPTPGGVALVEGSGGGGGQVDRAASVVVDSSRGSTFPVPLLVLGGLSLALLAAGGHGWISRRRDDTDRSGGDTRR